MAKINYTIGPMVYSHSNSIFLSKCAQQQNKLIKITDCLTLPTLAQDYIHC